VILFGRAGFLRRKEIERRLADMGVK